MLLPAERPGHGDPALAEEDRLPGPGRVECRGEGRTSSARRDGQGYPELVQVLSVSLGPPVCLPLGPESGYNAVVCILYILLHYIFTTLTVT